LIRVHEHLNDTRLSADDIRSRDILCAGKSLRDLLGNPTQQIKNPLLRFLHTQGYGRNKLPIYPGLAERESLLTEIRQHGGLVDQTSMNRT